MGTAMQYTASCRIENDNPSAVYGNIKPYFIFTTNKSLFAYFRSNLTYMSVFEKHYKKIPGLTNILVCKICATSVKYESAHKHSSNLRNHLNLEHKDALDEPQPKLAKITDYVVPKSATSPLPNLYALDRQAIAAYCLKHVIPYVIGGSIYFNLLTLAQ